MSDPEQKVEAPVKVKKIQHVMDVKQLWSEESPRCHQESQDALEGGPSSLRVMVNAKDQSSLTSQVPDSTDFVYSRTAAPKHLVPRTVAWARGTVRSSCVIALRHATTSDFLPQDFLRREPLRAKCPPEERPGEESQCQMASTL